MSTRFFSGHESWVFHAGSVEELCGFHADLIADALYAREQVRYLLYSPLREADGAPFGVSGGSGSHALAVTDHRVIVSRDPHRPGVSRTVCSVPFSRILAIELGEALTLGWLVLRFASQGRVASETVFFQSSGIGLFRTAVRLVRRNGTGTGSERIDASNPDWDRLLAPSPPYLRHQLVPLLLEEECPERVVPSDEQWVASGRSSRCVSPHGIHIVTDRAILIAESERPDQPGALVFAVRVVSVARHVVEGARNHQPRAREFWNRQSRLGLRSARDSSPDAGHIDRTRRGRVRPGNRHSGAMSAHPVIPFVGRTRELRRLREWLDAGRSIVLTGAFGSGRTTLVRQLASEVDATYCFHFPGPAVTRAELRWRMRMSTPPGGSHRAVLVIDDVCHLTPQKRALWRELTRNGMQMLVIVERSLPTQVVAVIRAALGAAPLLSLGPLSLRAAEQYFVEGSKAFGLRWNRSEVRGTARSTGGIPLTMRMTLDAAIRRAHGHAERCFPR